MILKILKIINYFPTMIGKIISRQVRGLAVEKHCNKGYANSVSTIERKSKSENRVYKYFEMQIETIPKLIKAELM